MSLTRGPVQYFQMLLIQFDSTKLSLIDSFTPFTWKYEDVTNALVR